MQTSVNSVEVSGRNESSKTGVVWGPIFAGAFAAVTITIVLMLVGTGLGLTMASPYGGEGASGTTFAVTAIIWLIVVQWLSSGVGGYLAGRLRTKWAGVHSDEVYFRDTAHGFMAWAVATVFILFVAGSAISSLIGAGASAVSSVVSGTASTVATAASGQGNEATSYFSDMLFRQNNPSLGTPARDDSAALKEASRILVTSAANGSMSDGDRTYLAQLISSQTGISQADAEKRIDTVQNDIEAAKIKAQQVAEAARKEAAKMALFTALSLAIGAFIASAAAAYGGRQRDDEEERYLVAR